MSREAAWGAAHPERRVCTYYSTRTRELDPKSSDTLNPTVYRLFPTLLCAAALAGCGGDDPESAAPAPAKREAALAGAPAPLAKLHAQANDLLGGGLGFFDEIAFAPSASGKRRVVAHCRVAGR